MDFVYSSAPWFVRGGFYGGGTSAGVFAFFYGYGRAYTGDSARAVLR